MKFKEIPQLITDGDYEVAVHLGHTESTIQSYIEDYGLELNPDFQRGHVWTEQQQIAYVEFMLRGGKTSRVIYFNCYNFRNGTATQPIVCVDGLQRLTAIRKFLNNEIKVFGCCIDEFEDKKEMLRGVYIKFNINELPTKKDVLKWYLQMNTGGTPHSKEEIDRVKSILERENGYE
ncbi:MAG: DUF262 domain-containing protein [Clostridium sp.]